MKYFGIYLKIHAVFYFSASGQKPTENYKWDTNPLAVVFYTNPAYEPHASKLAKSVTFLGFPSKFQEFEEELMSKYLKISYWQKININFPLSYM